MHGEMRVGKRVNTKVMGYDCKTREIPIYGKRAKS